MALVHWCAVIVLADALECVVKVDANDAVIVEDDADTG
jgi:hypothetical protein